MAAAAEIAEGLLTSRSGRALSFACSFTFCLMAAGALAITLFGRPHAPAIVMDLHAPAGARAPAPTPAQTGDGPVMGRVTQPIYAGKALLADPALIENTAEGPLPRIADDGRKPRFEATREPNLRRNRDDALERLPHVLARRLRLTRPAIEEPVEEFHPMMCTPPST